MAARLGKRKYPFVSSKSNSVIESPNVNVKTLIIEIKSKITESALTHIPPVIFLHQLYGAAINKTWVDQELNRLKSTGEIVMLKLRVDREDLSIALTLTEELSTHIKKFSSSRVVHNFVDNILGKLGDVSIDKVTLMTRFKLSENSIKELVRENVLVIRDVGRFWMSFPNAGDFVKAYTTGRRHLLGCLQRSKYAEILEVELLKKKPGKKTTLGMAYYIADLIGSEDIKRVSTTSGTVLRIRKDD